MAKPAISLPRSRPEPHVEERTVRSGDLSMRLLINHSHSHARFTDFRVGNYPAKRALLDQVAAQERLCKVFTLVEKSDSNAWRSAGFVREGAYPGFFRTADAYAMARLYDGKGTPVGSGPLKASPSEQIRFPERKLRRPDGLALQKLEDEQSRDEVLQRLDGALGPLPFARFKAPDLVIHAQDRRHEGWVCAEVDESFAHATISFAPLPTDDSELVLSAYAGNSLVSDLRSAEINNVFGLTPSSDRWGNELFSGLGFRITGRLAGHLRATVEHSNALLWHLKL